MECVTGNMAPIIRYSVSWPSDCEIQEPTVKSTCIKFGQMSSVLEKGNLTRHITEFGIRFDAVALALRLVYRVVVNLENS